MLKQEDEKNFTGWLLRSRLIGRPGIHQLDTRIYNFIVLISACISGPLAILSYIQGLHVVAVAVAAVFTVITSILYYISVKTKRCYRLFFCLLILAATILEWIFNGGGSKGAMQYYFLYAFIIPVILIKGKKRVLVIVLSYLSLLLLNTYEYFDGSLIVQYPDKTTRYIDIMISSGFSFLLAALIVLVIYNQINLERKKSDELLLNILPKKIISDLKNTGETHPDVFKNVTVLFSDVVDFTKISETLPTDVLIRELNEMFTIFDGIIARNHCERIKTIGDGYLATCGLPEENPDHCQNIVNAAVAMMQAIEERNKKNKLQFCLRIGIQTGEVIGSVVGVQKYIYDVFGDTVNTASRLETISNPMEITVSTKVMELLDGKFSFVHKGKAQIKGKGEMDLHTIAWNAERSVRQAH
jgi:class 3 adenylate cyclase